MIILAWTLTVKLTKPWTPEIFMECYCVARNKPIRRKITKPQTATVISLWFRGLLTCPELYCDWPVHNQHSWNFSGVHSFLSLTVKKNSLKLKMLGPLCNQTVNLKTYTKTLYYSILKLKDGPFILQHNKGYKKCGSLNNSYNNCHRNYANRIFLQIDMFRSINWSLSPMGHMPWIILRLWGFLCVRNAGGRGTKITG